MPAETRMICVSRVDRTDGRVYWCRAKYKKTLRYQDSIAVACGGYVILSGGIEYREPTCPDCLAGRKWCDK